MKLMKNIVRYALLLMLCACIFLSCSHKSVPAIDPLHIDAPGYVGSKDEFLNDPINKADFGSWELLHHINFYYADKYEGEITPPYYVMFVNIAGFESERFGIAVGPDDDSRFTKNGGKVWTKANGGEVFCRFGLDIVNGSTAWNNGNGGVKYTSNGGRSWNAVSQIHCLPYIAFYNKNIGWIASSFNILSTTDKGKTFQEIILPSKDVRISAISLRTGKQGYLLDAEGILYKTYDFGKTWASSSIRLEEGERLFSGTHIRSAVRFTDMQNGKIICTKQDSSLWAYTTTDGGTTWEKNEITGLQNRSAIFEVYLSRNAEILTLTSNFEDRNESFVLKYKK